MSWSNVYGEEGHLSLSWQTGSCVRRQKPDAEPFSLILDLATGEC